MSGGRTDTHKGRRKPLCVNAFLCSLFSYIPFTQMASKGILKVLERVQHNSWLNQDFRNDYVQGLDSGNTFHSGGCSTYLNAFPVNKNELNCSIEPPSTDKHAHYAIANQIFSHLKPASAHIQNIITGGEEKRKKKKEAHTYSSRLAAGSRARRYRPPPCRSRCRGWRACSASSCTRSCGRQTARRTSRRRSTAVLLGRAHFWFR